MLVPYSGYTNRLGPSVQYEYNAIVGERTLESAAIRLELRLKTSAVLGDVLHQAVEEGGTVPNVVLIKGSDMPVDGWSAWFTVYDKVVGLTADETSIGMLVNLWNDGEEAQEQVNLGNGIAVGEYVRPSQPVVRLVSPTTINVKEQNEREVTVWWYNSAAAVSYRVYLNTDKVMRGAQYIGSFTEPTCTFNPKQEMFGGVAWQSFEMLGGTELYIGIEARDAEGAPSANVTWWGPLTYYEEPAFGPNLVFAIGGNGIRNEVVYSGELVKFYYAGQRAGSYEVTDFELIRPDGSSRRWNVKDSFHDDVGDYIQFSTEAWDRADQRVQYELRAYNSMGHEVFPEDGARLRFTVWFYGGTMYVYDDEGESGWRYGLCWTYDGSSWRRAKAVYVRTASGWKTL